VRVVFGALHLRPGAKGWFLQWLGQQHPELVSSYRGLYPGVAAYAPKGYRAWLGKRVRPLLRAHGLDGRLEDDQPRRAVTGPVVTTSLAAPRGAASPRRVDAAADRLF